MKRGTGNLELGTLDHRQQGRGAVIPHSAIAVPHSTRGFTLIEILVVVAILMVLMGIGIAYGPGMLAPNEVAQTRTTLKNLAAINDEFALRTGSRVNAANINQFLATVTGGSYKQLGDQEPFVNMIASFSDKILRRTDPTEDESYWQVYDAWGKIVVYVTPGYATKTVEVDNKTSDSELDLELLPRKSFAYFASAGPDGQWGDDALLQEMLVDGPFSNDSKQKLATEAADNVYSFGN
ncbi:prepilin-type N-terminal cleavage/methylation domain-containing protein [Planctomycetales bacterium ZRK34]|nr:prepilin-type N-terminal cleavage/methylation domain-containing protein [Planctomycetales bacterium ZRK34]